MFAHSPQIQQATQIDLSTSSFSGPERLFAQMANDMSVGQLLLSYQTYKAAIPDSQRQLYDHRTQELGQIVSTGAFLVRDMLGLDAPGTDKLKSLDDGTLSKLAQALGVNGAELAAFEASSKEQRAEDLKEKLNAQLNNPDTILEVMATLADANDPALDRSQRELLAGMLRVAVTDISQLRLLAMESIAAEAQRAAAAGQRGATTSTPTSVTQSNPPDLQVLLSIYENAEKLRDLPEVGKALVALASKLMAEARLSYHRAEVEKVRSDLTNTQLQLRGARELEASLRWRGSPEANSAEFTADNLDSQARNRQWLLDTLIDELNRMKQAQETLVYTA